LRSSARGERLTQQREAGIKFSLADPGVQRRRIVKWTLERRRSFPCLPKFRRVRSSKTALAGTIISTRCNYPDWRNASVLASWWLSVAWRSPATEGTSVSESEKVMSVGHSEKFALALLVSIDGASMTGWVLSRAIGFGMRDHLIRYPHVRWVAPAASRLGTIYSALSWGSY